MAPGGDIPAEPAPACPDPKLDPGFPASPPRPFPSHRSFSLSSLLANSPKTGHLPRQSGHISAEKVNTSGRKGEHTRAENWTHCPHRLNTSPTSRRPRLSFVGAASLTGLFRTTTVPSAPKPPQPPHHPEWTHPHPGRTARILNTSPLTPSSPFPAVLIPLLGERVGVRGLPVVIAPHPPSAPAPAIPRRAVIPPGPGPSSNHLPSATKRGNPARPAPTSPWPSSRRPRPGPSTPINPSAPLADLPRLPTSRAHFPSSNFSLLSAHSFPLPLALVIVSCTLEPSYPTSSPRNLMPASHACLPPPLPSVPACSPPCVVADLRPSLPVSLLSPLPSTLPPTLRRRPTKKSAQTVSRRPAPLWGAGRRETVPPFTPHHQPTRPRLAPSPLVLKAAPALAPSTVEGPNPSAAGDEFRRRPRQSVVTGGGVGRRLGGGRGTAARGWIGR